MDPLVEVFVGLGLADEDEVVVVAQRAAAKRLMSIQVVAQERVIAGVVKCCVVVQPALAGIDLAVLFRAAVLRNDELGA